ncbi:MAG: DHHA1 domain-containing protein, partial [Granulosicoccus sp.]
VLGRITQLQSRNRELTRQVEQLQIKLAASAGHDLAGEVESIAGVSVLLQVVEDSDAKALRVLMDQLREKLKPAAIVLASEKAGKVALIATVDKSLNDRVSAGDLLQQVAQVLGGRGGGRADMAQGGAESLDHAEAAFMQARQWLGSQLAH